MKEKRSLFDIFFKKPKNREVSATHLRLLNPTSESWFSATSDLYASDLIRSTVDTIARNTAKLTPIVAIKLEGKSEILNNQLSKLISKQPNPYMNAYDFYYKIISKLMIKNNAFIKINKDFRGNVNSLYPIDYSSVTILDAGSEPLYEFRFSSGEVERLYTEEFIHLRRHFCSNDLLGTSNYEALKASLETLTTIDQGIVNNIKNSATLRGVIQYEKSFLRPEDIKRERDSFVNEYLNLEDSSGVAALDAKAKFIPLDNKGNPIDPQLHEIIKTKIFNYFGVNEKIINSSYNDSEWMSFYESVIEPIAVQMSLEFTNKLLTKERQRYGEQIIFQANKLVHASLEAKAKLLKEVMPMGLFTINEAREVLNLPVVEGGEQRLMSLNYVNADKADEYQLGEKTQDNQQEEKEDKDDNE